MPMVRNLVSGRERIGPAPEMEANVLGIFEELAELSQVAAIHGLQAETAALLARRWRPWLDESRASTLGNFIGLARGTDPEPRPCLVAAAHMDVIGFMVTHVETGGFLRLAAVGGVNRRLLLGQEVEVLGRRRLVGVIGAKPPHLSTPDERKKLVPLEDLSVDLGLPEAEVRETVRPGDAVLYRQDVVALRNGRVAGRYLDDTAGLAIIGVALEELRREPHSADFYAVGTVGEETGRLSGGATVAFELRPSLAVAVEVAFGASPGEDDPTNSFALGSGPAIGIGANCHPRLVRLFKAAADELGLATTLEVMPGRSGTDAWAMQTARGGVPTAILSVPLRYMHTPVETASLDDIRSAGQLLAAVARKVDWALVEALSCYDPTK
jgi:putative aminopeptidase FrvX